MEDECLLEIMWRVCFTTIENVTGSEGCGAWEGETKGTSIL